MIEHCPHCQGPMNKCVPYMPTPSYPTADQYRCLKCNVTIIIPAPATAILPTQNEMTTEIKGVVALVTCTFCDGTGISSEAIDEHCFHCAGTGQRQGHITLAELTRAMKCEVAE